MTDRFDAAYYEDLRGRVRGILIATAELLQAQQAGLVDELIDANESGLALELLTEMLVERRAEVDVQVIEQIEELASDIGLAPELVQRVQTLKAT